MKRLNPKACWSGVKPEPPSSGARAGPAGSLLPAPPRSRANRLHDLQRPARLSNRPAEALPLCRRLSRLGMRRGPPGSSPWYSRQYDRGAHRRRFEPRPGRSPSAEIARRPDCLNNDHGQKARRQTLLSIIAATGSCTTALRCNRRARQRLGRQRGGLKRHADPIHRACTSLLARMVPPIGFQPVASRHHRAKAGCSFLSSPAGCSMKRRGAARTHQLNSFDQQCRATKGRRSPQ